MKIDQGNITLDESLNTYLTVVESVLYLLMNTNINVYSFIKTMPCLACGRKKAQPHHIKTRGAGGENRIDNLIPLCEAHHNECHLNAGIFMDKYNQVKMYQAMISKYNSTLNQTNQ
jgi:hypothetical protein